MFYVKSNSYKYNNDPWGDSKNKSQDKKKEINKNNNLPDLEDYFQRIYHKLSKFNTNNSMGTMKKNNYYIYYILAIILVILVSSGFYTIKEAERGVLLRFGKFDHIVQPGLNWRPIFIDTVTTVNVESVRELAASGVMLTSDENVVCVEMNVQYRVIDPKLYLFSVTDADNSLRQATDSALRGVIGKYDMDRILTEGRTLVRSDTQRVLEETIYPYNMGIALLDVNFQTARPPEEVKASFDDAIAARENEQQYIREAEAYANEVQPKANGQAQRILEEGRAYKTRTILEAQGEIQRFNKIIPEYKIAPNITRERLYITTMERILSNTKKILINEKINNLTIIPIDKILSLNQNEVNKITTSHNSNNDLLNVSNINNNNKNSDKFIDNYTNKKIVNHDRINNVKRTNITREIRN